MKITRGLGARGCHLGGRAPRSPRNFKGQNIENEKIFDISKPGPTDSDEGP